MKTQRAAGHICCWHKAGRECSCAQSKHRDSKRCHQPELWADRQADTGSRLNRHLHEKDLGVLIEGRLRMIPRCEPERRGSLSLMKETRSPGKGRSQPSGPSVHMLTGLVQLLSRGVSGGNQSGRTSVVSSIWRLGSAAGIGGRGGTWLSAKICRDSWWFNPILFNRQNRDPPETGRQVYAHTIISQTLELWEVQSSSLRCGGSAPQDHSRMKVGVSICE